jgi:uncharacterized protein YhjY with autotransporter beta-barrel domain
MNTGIVKSKARGLALMGKVLVGVMVVVASWMPRLGIAGTQDALFLQYLQNTCGAATAPPSWDVVSLGNLCAAMASAGPAGSAATASDVSANLGSINAGSGASARKKKGVRGSLEELKSKADKGASADGGGWGVLVTPQYSKSNRTNTDLENGYQSKLTGMVVGLDYRFSEKFVLGMALGHTQDKATFVANAGFSNNTSNTATMYGTWLYSEDLVIDGYLGYGSFKLDNQRRVAIGSLIAGTMTGNTTGRQIMAGLSVSNQSVVGKLSLTPFFNLDHIKTSISGYNEKGSNYNANLLALRYGDRSVISTTSSLGVRLGTTHGYSWGELAPSVRLAAVHEFQNKARQISNELVITPGASYQVETDSPDRNYLNLGLGISAALNRGGQLFFDYERRTKDKLLSSWAVSIGGLFEF